jgi:hypothetical protein
MGERVTRPAKNGRARGAKDAATAALSRRVYDARVRPEVEALAADERGMLLGLLVSGAGPEVVAHVDGPGSAGCAVALAAIPADARAAERDALAAELTAPWPKGIERIHAGWIRRVLEGEPSHVVRAVVRGAPEPIRRVADELLSARGEAEASSIAEGPWLDGLRRAVFGALAPMPEPAADAAMLGRRLCAASGAELLDEIDRRGAAMVGLALSGAPDAVVARAAAGAGDAAARVLLASSRAPASSEARARARVLVASVGAGSGAQVVRAVGLAALAALLAAEGPGALAAVAQRLAPSLGDALLARGGGGV